MVRALDPVPVRPRNDPAQYDDLVDSWWDPAGDFAMLHWLAAARAAVLPPATAGALLVDIACGGGLLAPHVRRLGYRHVGVDLGEGATRTAAAHGLAVCRADATLLPLRDGCADVVVAGEVLEHVADPDAVVAEACRVLRPGGTVVLDTIAATRWGRFTAVTLAERLPGGPPPRLHDPALFVDRARLVRTFAEGGVALALTGLLPAPWDYLRWLRDRSRGVRLLRLGGTAGLFQGIGIKGSGIARAGPAGAGPADGGGWRP